MYQVLYRKYRPRVFSDVYGQDHITSTLKNEIKNNRISHAYLFTGSRGTGKTTCAKILAKAVNCENNANGEPCNECEVCKGLDSGAIYDVVEIDAASNNGVDNIRDLREDANYTPSRGKYRVYIIDEVHMLSTGAFNALLKTLEEPPAHVIFILATTEVHKLPATILSRCQRFDFKRIQPETMAVRLKQVAGYEKLELDDDAAVLIARIADGALRDGLSILDQCAGKAQKITAQIVSEVAGIAGRQAMYTLSDCVANKDSSAAMSVISSLYQNSFDMERLCVEMINHFRNFLIVKTVKKSRELIVCTDDEYKNIVDGAKQFTVENIIYALDLFQNTLVTVKGGASARIEVEMAFVKLCEPKLEESLSAVLDRLSSLERAVKNGVSVRPVSYDGEDEDEPVTPQIDQSKPPVPARTQSRQEAAAEPKAVMPAAAEPNAAEADTQPSDIPPAVDNRTDDAPVNPAPPQEPTTQQTREEFNQWGEFMDALHKIDMPVYSVLSGAKGYVTGEHFLIDSPNPIIKSFLNISSRTKAIKKALYEVTGKTYKLGIIKKEDPNAVKRDPLEDLINSARSADINADIK